MTRGRVAAEAVPARPDAVPRANGRRYQQLILGPNVTWVVWLTARSLGDPQVTAIPDRGVRRPPRRRKTWPSLANCLSLQVAAEPIHGQRGHLLQGSGLFEQVGGAGDDLEALLARGLVQSLTVEPDHHPTLVADDQQGRGPITELQQIVLNTTLGPAWVFASHVGAEQVELAWGYRLPAPALDSSSA